MGLGDEERSKLHLEEMLDQFPKEFSNYLRKSSGGAEAQFEKALKKTKVSTVTTKTASRSQGEPRVPKDSYRGNLIGRRAHDTTDVNVPNLTSQSWLFPSSPMVNFEFCMGISTTADSKWPIRKHSTSKKRAMSKLMDNPTPLPTVEGDEEDECRDLGKEELQHREDGEDWCLRGLGSELDKPGDSTKADHDLRSREPEFNEENRIDREEEVLIEKWERQGPRDVCTPLWLANDRKCRHRHL
ncbi:hypothetical protein PDIDSM_3349 [Penicillium digitatum]|nr:hypothetical protein PDIDSM_3349 [Penicillium digitatum]